MLLGDCAVGFSGIEFDTMARLGINIASIIGNNGIRALEKHPLEFLYGYSVAADLAPGRRYEPGSGAVVKALQRGAAISTVNVAEVLTKLAAEGAEPEPALAQIEELEGALEFHALERADLVEIARLRPLTRQRGLSLGDRAGLLLATRLAVPAMTTVSAWSTLDSIRVQVVVVR